MTKTDSSSPDVAAPRHTTASRHRSVLLSGLLIAACLFCWLERRALSSVRDTFATATHQLDQMRADVLSIQRLQEAPRAATSRTRPNEELLDQVQQALSSADIDRTKWHDSIPQPGVRVPGSDYKRLTTRLYFDSVTLRQLAAFVHHLQANDPTLRIAGLNLTSPHSDRPDFDVEVAVSYLVYAPTIGGT